MTDTHSQILEAIDKLIATKHVTVTAAGYHAWKQSLDEARLSLIQSSPDEFLVEVNRLLANLKASHTAFLKPQGETIPLRHALCATVRPTDTTNGKRWMFQDVIEGGPAYLAGIKPGQVLVSKDSVDVFPPAMPTFGFGHKYSLRVGGPAEGDLHVFDLAVPDTPAKDRPPMIEPRALSFRVHESGVPVVTISSFPGAVGVPFVRELDAIMTRLREERRDRLIIDLRGNIGGGLASLRLMSYLCPDSKLIGYSLTRKGIKRGLSAAQLPKIRQLPISNVSQLAMFLHFRFIHKDRSVRLETEGLGAQPFHGRIAMVINEHTHSAAEMVAAFAKENGLATLVGTKTAGEVLGGANFKVGGPYLLRIPVTTWNTQSGLPIEGLGVTPDIEAPFNQPESVPPRDSQLDCSVRVLSSDVVLS
jgi:carboxyl-terminal processing protease